VYLGRTSARAFLIHLALFCAGMIVTSSLLLTADLYVHSRHSIELNVAGYRGAILGPKRADEVRVEVLGSSTAYGYGLPTEQSVPAQLEGPLAAALGRPVSVANLAGAGETAVCYADTLRQFEYLDADVVVLYTGDRDTDASSALRDPATCLRRRSPIFAATGYFPVLAEIAREKYYSLRYGDVDKGYRENYSLGSRSAPQSIGAIPGAPGTKSSRTVEPEARGAEIVDPVTAFVARIDADVKTELERGRVVVVVAEPGADPALRARQADALKGALQQYVSTPGFRYVDLIDFIDLNDRALSFDRVHVTAEGARRVALALAGPLTDAFTAVVDRRHR
jgi:hypothetical protein